MKDLSLRSAIGVENCNWNTAGEFALPIRRLDILFSDDDKDRTCKRTAQDFYNILFQPFGKSLVDNKRRCAWYFDRYLPAHNHQVPDNFDMIHLVPQGHYICFYDISSADLKPKYLAKLNILKPHHRQHLFDVRYAQPKVRQRLLKLSGKIRAGKESLLKQTLKKSLPVTGINSKADGDNTQNTTTDKSLPATGINGEADGDAQTTTTDKSLPATGINGEADGDTHNTTTGKAGISRGETNQGSVSLFNALSNSDVKDFATTVGEDI